MACPGLYITLGNVVLDLALLMSKFPRDMVCWYLDNVYVATLAGSVVQIEGQVGLRGGSG